MHLRRRVAIGHFWAFTLALLASRGICAQTTAETQTENAGNASTNTWSYNLTVDGYLIPHGQGYADPVFTADRGWLHVEARYNWENLYTGSLWFGRNFSWGKSLQLSLTPMIGGVMGRTDGIAPGLEATLTYKKLTISDTNEYVFDTSEKSGNFFATNPELKYQFTGWLKGGLIAQKNKAFHSKLDVQRGFFGGITHKNWEFTTYVYNAGWTDPTVVLEIGVNF